MASLTKEQKRAEERIKAMIVDGHARGVCNNEGQSMRHPEYGVPIARPKIRGRVSFHRVYRRV
jgi:hypothetical protein